MATEEAVPDHPEAEEERGFPVYDRMLYGVLDFVGLDQDTVTTFLEDNYIESRIAADGLSLGRVAVGCKIMDVYDEAVERGDTTGALMATGALVATLATDFVDGFIARGADITHHKHGAYLDALSDVALRARIAKSIAINPTNSNVPKWEKVAQLARVGGDALVGTTTVYDFLTGQYETTKTGKYKVNADAVYVVGAMFEKALDASGTERGKARKALHAVIMGGLLTATTLAYKDGADRIWEKIQRGLGKYLTD